MGLAAGVLVFWLFGGPHWGWTRTSEPVQRRDPVTEVEYVEWEPRFLPGVDFLAAGLVVALAVYAGAALFRPPETEGVRSRS